MSNLKRTQEYEDFKKALDILDKNEGAIYVEFAGDYLVTTKSKLALQAELLKQRMVANKAIFSNKVN